MVLSSRGSLYGIPVKTIWSLRVSDVHKCACCYAISEVLGNIRVSSTPQRDRIRSVKIVSSSRHSRQNILNIRTMWCTCAKHKYSPLPRKCSFAGRKMFLLLRQVCITCTVHVPTLQYPCGHPTFVLVSIMTTYFDTLRTVRRSVVAKI